MKNLLFTSTAAILLGSTAMAENHMGAFADKTFDVTTDLRASELVGARVYATEADIQNTVPEGGETEWDDIGEIDEIILDRSGASQHVIVGVGGFLGIGEKDVAIDMSQLKFVSDGEDSNDYFVVVKASTLGIEEAPDYRDDSMEPGSEEVAMSDASTDESTDMGTKEVDMADNANPATDGRPMLPVPNVERDGYDTAVVDDLNTEDLTGARVYGINDEDVGEISELLVTDDGKIDRAVIDVGGFLGLGEKPVAVTMDELQIIRGQDGGELRVYIESSQELLEEQPAYQG